jgi:hypothetical protein
MHHLTAGYVLKSESLGNFTRQTSHHVLTPPWMVQPTTHLAMHCLVLRGYKPVQCFTALDMVGSCDKLEEGWKTLGNGKSSALGTLSSLQSVVD